MEVEFDLEKDYKGRRSAKKLTISNRNGGERESYKYNGAKNTTAFNTTN